MDVILRSFVVERATKDLSVGPTERFFARRFERRRDQNDGIGDMTRFLSVIAGNRDRVVWALTTTWTELSSSRAAGAVCG